MVKVSRRSGSTDSALVRVLVGLTGSEVVESRQSLSDRLSQWLSLTDAIGLYAVLNGSPAKAALMAPPVAARASFGAASDGSSSLDASAEQRDLSRVRTTLATAIADDVRSAALVTSGDFAPYRRRYLARQQAMEIAIGPLRARLRTTLAAGSPAMAQLAGVDAVMAQALEARERKVLAKLPALLEQHFKRLRDAAMAKSADPVDSAEQGDPTGDGPSLAWLGRFGSDMHALLLAELEIRLQPVEGLLEALQKT